jgi:hypothetical protein
MDGHDHSAAGGHDHSESAGDPHSGHSTHTMAMFFHWSFERTPLLFDWWIVETPSGDCSGQQN